MEHSEIGKLAFIEWFRTKNMRQDMKIELDEFIIMPDHIHGIITIGRNMYNKYPKWKINESIASSHNDCDDVPHCRGRRDAMHCRDAMHGVSTTNNNTKTNSNSSPKNSTKCKNSGTYDKNIVSNNPKNQFGPQRKNLGSIIRGFKSAVTMKARRINPVFGWQAGYYDRIIRDDKSLNQIRKYILENPKNWKS